MPQLSKGGKYVFGWSKISENGDVIIPAEAIEEYHLAPREKIILISGSKASGGFVVSPKPLLEQSKIANVLTENPALAEFQLEEGKTIKFKGRLYCWVGFGDNGSLTLPAHTRQAFALKPGDFLLSIRGSDIAFVMGVKGPIIELAKTHPEIVVFS